MTFNVADYLDQITVARSSALFRETLKMTFFKAL